MQKVKPNIFKYSPENLLIVSQTLRDTLHSDLNIHLKKKIAIYLHEFLDKYFSQCLEGISCEGISLLTEWNLIASEPSDSTETTLLSKMNIK
jgi:hypothetical protein